MTTEINEDLLNEGIRFQSAVFEAVVKAIQHGQETMMTPAAQLQHIAQEVTHITLTSSLVRDEVREMYAAMN